MSLRSSGRNLCQKFVLSSLAACVILLVFLRHSVIVGAGYIAVEIAGILSTLGSKTSLLIRHDKVQQITIPNVAYFPVISVPIKYSS